MTVSCILLATSQILTINAQRDMKERISLMEQTQRDIVEKQNYMFELLSDSDEADTTAIRVKRTKNTVVHTDLDVFCLAKNIFHEAGVEDEIGMFAVAQVTLNRLQDDSYPKTICKVVMQSGQFSWTNNKNQRWSHPKGPNWEAAQQVAKKVINDGYRVPGLQTAMFYHASYSKPRWRNPDALIATVGSHVFYSAAR